MRRAQITGAVLIAVMALGGTAAGTASASPKTLELTEGATGKALPPGEFVELHSSDDSLKYTGPEIGTYGCFGGFEDINGELRTNSAKTDELVLYDAFGNLNEEDVAACNYPQKVTGFPWTLRLAAKGTAKVSGVLDAYEVVGGSPYCPQEAKKILATPTFGAVTLEISATFTKNIGTERCTLGDTVDLGVMEARVETPSGYKPLYAYVR